MCTVRRYLYSKIVFVSQTMGLGRKVLMLSTLAALICLPAAAAAVVNAGPHSVNHHAVESQRDKAVTGELGSMARK